MRKNTLFLFYVALLLARTVSMNRSLKTQMQFAVSAGKWGYLKTKNSKRINSWFST